MISQSVLCDVECNFSVKSNKILVIMLEVVIKTWGLCKNITRNQIQSDVL